jgi:hypothetical protein
MVALPQLAGSQQNDLTVSNSLENFKRGTIHSMHPERRSLVIIWEDRGRVKMKAADLVTNFNQLKPGQIITAHWYDPVDFLIARKTPEVTAGARQMVVQGARLEGIPGARQRINLWTMEGMVTKIDHAANTLYIIDVTGNEIDESPPNSGDVIQLPSVVTESGKAALRTIKAGNIITVVFSQPTAIDVTIIR